MNLSSLTTSELLVILDITRQLAERRMVRPLMAYVATTVFEIIPAERCMIVLFADDGTPVVQVAQDRLGESLGTATDQMSHTILKRVRASMTPLQSYDALAEEDLLDASGVHSLGLRSVLCVPLISYGQAIGAIYVENRSARNQFREENLVPLALFSHQVVAALENARLYESLEARIAERTQALQAANAQLAGQAAELREQATHDGLTGLYNDRYFNECLPQLFELARRAQRPLTVASIDIDNFKQITETYFHSGGDRVLTTVASMLQTNIRQADTIARIGVEEFVIIMPESALVAMIPVCERLRLAIERYNWDTIEPGLHVTISIGVADDTGCADEQELLRNADLHLFAAKRLGKNRVVAAGSAV
jgi:diguanylate cyclase (GGDEF)-like protein